MVRRAKVPRDRNNRIVGPFNHRELSGWPDGVNGAPALRRKKKRKPKRSKTWGHLPQHVVEAVSIGESL